MQNWKRVFAYALVLTFLVSGLSAGVKAITDESDANPTVDFVLLLDCSGSLREMDANGLCKQACKMFLDMKPVENARIAIIAFGPTPTQCNQARPELAHPYVLSSWTDVSSDEIKDMNRVHLIAPLTPVENIASGSALESLKNNTDKVAGINGGYTPIGSAAVAAIDLLESNGATDGNACVILVSDGEAMGSNGSPTGEYELLDAAAARAEGHVWPIYTLQLNRNEKNGKNTTATQKMLTVSQNTGAGPTGYGHYNLTDFSAGATDVARAFASIFDRFMGANGPITDYEIGASGMIEYEFTVENLTSETTIVASGNGVKSIRLEKLDSNEEMRPNRDYILTIEPGSYVCAKMICPKPGNWVAYIEGDENTRLILYECSMRQMDMRLSCQGADLTNEVEKDQTLRFRSDFTYHGNPVTTKEEFFAELDASLTATNLSTGEIHTFTQDSDRPGKLRATTSGYATELTLGDLGDGTYEFTFMIQDEMFRNGMKLSNTLTAKTHNYPLVITDTHLNDVEGLYNRPVDQEARFDINAHVLNEDNDKLEYELVCVNDRNYKVGWHTDAENYFYIDNCGPQPGTYTLKLSVKEPAGEWLEFDPFTLTVGELEFVWNEFTDVVIWTDAYRCQPKPVKMVELFLADQYYDPDGAPMQIDHIDGGEGSGSVYKIEYHQKNQVVQITGLEKGRGVLSFQVSDGFTVKEIRVPIRVDSGKAIWWEENWIKVALIALALVIASILAIVMHVRTRPRGKWDITMEDDKYTVPATIEGWNLRSVKDCEHYSFKLSKLLKLLPSKLKNGPEYSLLLGSCLSDPAFKSITVRGVPTGAGCVFCNLPKSDSVELKVGGALCHKNTKISPNSGKAVLTCKNSGGEELKITFSVKAR